MILLGFSLCVLSLSIFCIELPPWKVTKCLVYLSLNFFLFKISNTANTSIIHVNRSSLGFSVILGSIKWSLDYNIGKPLNDVYLGYKSMEALIKGSSFPGKPLSFQFPLSSGWVFFHQSFSHSLTPSPQDLTWKAKTQRKRKIPGVGVNGEQAVLLSIWWLTADGHNC